MFKLNFVDFQENFDHSANKRETKPCDGEDLKCALVLGVPAIVVLIFTLTIYLLCRLNFRFVFWGGYQIALLCDPLLENHFKAACMYE